MGKRKWIIKILKWSFSILFILIIISAWYPLEAKFENTGRKLFVWSGWSALFNDNNFRLKFNFYEEVEFDGIDGPYIVGNSLFKVNNNVLEKESLEDIDSVEVVVNNQDQDKFFVKLLEENTIEDSKYPMPNRLIAISDIEGNFNGFSSFLQSNGVIDQDFNWNYADGHLVLVGDFVDRGSSVTQVLWLIYKLDYQAEKAGGKVHFILGNHEVMNFQGNGGYNDEKYIRVAQEVSGMKEWEKAIAFIYSDNTELGRWLKTKNVIEKIGDYLFVHAGLHPEILDYKLDISSINEKTSENWDKDLYRRPGDDPIANFLIGRISPIWYRGLAIDYKYYDKINEPELDQVLSHYGAKKIVIGHTVVQDISTDFNGKVIKIDLKHGQKKNSGKTKGLLIDNGEEYIIDDLGNKEKL